MSRCASREEFQQLLAEQLSEALRQAMETHVEECVTCQETLARLSDESGEVDAQLRCPASPVPLAESEADFVQRLKDNPPWLGQSAPHLAKKEKSAAIAVPKPTS